MDSEQLQFRGQDAAECEDFIAAIMKRAYAQGKQRDDQWMADFAAICMVNDALRWWSDLDENVQGSWKHLRRAMLWKYRSKFYGKSGEEAEKFVRAVDDKAIDEGKHNDNEWIATYASACFAGEALRWYISIDSGTRDNWDKLRQAILIQYPRGSSGGPLLSIIPTPAAAVSIARAAGPTRRGRIRISSSNYSGNAYISKILPLNKRVSPTFQIHDALEVEWNPGPDGSQTLSIPGFQILGYDFLGIRWLSENPYQSPNFCGICAVNSHKNSTNLTGFAGRLLMNTWKLSQVAGSDQTLTISAIDGGEELYPRWNAAAQVIWFAPKNTQTSYVAEMFFESV